MADIQRSSDGIYHPRSEAEVQALVLQAAAAGAQIRVRGSGHSITPAILAAPVTAGPAPMNVMLDQLGFDPSHPNDKIRIDKENKTVTVKAGCHLGFDPYDIAGMSSWQNSLLYQLDQAGLGFADLGGIIHQTVGGFLSTGSSGGSLKDGFGDCIMALTIVDGNGAIHTPSRAAGDDLFFAAGVSMGLLGIITEVTFSVVDSWDIIGQQSTTDFDDTPIDLTGPGSAEKPSLAAYLAQEEYPYIRLNWWPQEGVNRMVVWKGKAMQPGDYTPQTGTHEHFIPNPYAEFPMFGKMGGSGFANPNIATEGPSELLAQGLGGLFYSVVGNWTQAIELLKPSFLVKAALDAVALLYPTHILPMIINAFNPRDTDPDSSGKPSGPTPFWDRYWGSLPMDNKVDDKLMPTDFTEIWIPIEHTDKVMADLAELYATKKYSATGSYSCELYAAKQSDFWLSPSYGGDRFRVDIFWYGYNASDPTTTYYPQFWDLLKTKYDCRFHWGKYQPLDPGYLSTKYPKWGAFMQLRAAMDPHNVFLTSYWRQYLGIA